MMNSSKPLRSLWPYAIIGAFTIFIGGTAGLIVLACSHRTDLVSADYYEQEIKFQNHLNRIRRTRELSVTGAIAYDAAKRRITISLPAEQLRHVVTGRVELYRPSAAGLDRQLTLAPDRSGVQRVEASDLRPGLWKVRVSWTVGDNDYFMDQRIVIGTQNRS